MNNLLTLHYRLTINIPKPSSYSEKRNKHWVNVLIAYGYDIIYFMYYELFKSQEFTRYPFLMRETSEHYSDYHISSLFVSHNVSSRTLHRLPEYLAEK